MRQNNVNARVKEKDMAAVNDEVCRGKNDWNYKKGGGKIGNTERSNRTERKEKLNTARKTNIVWQAKQIKIMKKEHSMTERIEKVGILNEITGISHDIR